MKQILTYLMLIAAALLIDSNLAVGQTVKEDRTAGLFRQCTTKENTAAIQADAEGNIKLAPCAGKKATVSGTPIVVDNDVRLFPKASEFKKADLPTPGIAGRIARITDFNRGLFYDNGSGWTSLNGVRFDVTAFGAKGDGTTDDTAAIQAAINAASASGWGAEVFFPRPSNFYRVNGQLSLYEKQGITLQGVGGAITNGTKGAIVFTKSGNTPMIDARGGKGCRFLDLKLMYSSPTYTGDFLDYSGLPSGDSGTMVMSRVLIAGSDFDSTLKVINARSLIRIHGSHTVTIEDSYFSTGETAILGKTKYNADGSEATNNFAANVIQIRQNHFRITKSYPIKNLGQGIVIDGNTFEGCLTEIQGRHKPCAYQDEPAVVNAQGVRIAVYEAQTLTFSNNWLGDAPWGSSHWVDTNTTVFNAFGNFVGEAGQTGYGFNFGGTGRISSITMHDNYYYCEYTPPCRPVNLQISVNTLTAYGEFQNAGNVYIYNKGNPGYGNFVSYPFIFNGANNEFGGTNKFPNAFTIGKINSLQDVRTENFIGKADNITGVEPNTLTYSTFFSGGDKPHQFLTNGKKRFRIAENNVSSAPLQVGESGTPIRGVFSANAQWDFDEIPANSTAEKTLTMQGATTGAQCTVSPHAAVEAGIIWNNCAVVSENTVSVRLANVTSAPINPAKCFYRVTVTAF